MKFVPRCALVALLLAAGAPVRSQVAADPDPQTKAPTEAAGSSRFLLTGWASGDFVSPQGENSTFSAEFDPIFLWKLGDRLFFESEVAVTLASGETNVDLEYAQLAYSLNNNVMLGAGRFLTPFGAFRERLHPAWINKLPDMPLALDEESGIAPTSSLGLEARGAFSAGAAGINAAVYVSNGPALNTQGDEAGTLDFGNFSDNNGGKAVGARVGILTVPELEVGYSFLTGKAGARATSFEDVGALLQAVDVSFVRTISPLKGSLDARLEWVWSRVDDATYGTVRFHNRRDGGYAQLAYRPAQAARKGIRAFEAVFRYDALRLPEGAPASTEQKRWAAGLNYWLGSSTVVKAAYERLRTTDRASGETTRSRAVLVQAAVGF